MNFIENKVEERSIDSIVWDSQIKAYRYTVNGTKIGDLLASSPKEYFEIANNVIDITSITGVKDGSHVYATRNYSIDSDSATETNFALEVYKAESKNELPYGVFDARIMDRQGLVFKPYTSSIVDENLIPNKSLKQDVLDFFNSPVITGRKNKKGMLLFGPPGCGKTNSILSLIPELEKNKIRMFFLNSKFDLDYLTNCRGLLEADKTIFVLEELTERLEKGGVEELLTFLDGENSWDNSVTIATTNYPSQFPSNLVDRPGRFDTFIEYDNPTKEQIVELGAKYGFTEEQSVELAGKKLSFDYTSFIMSQAKLKSLSLTEALKLENEKRKKLSETFKGKIGIGE